MTADAAMGTGLFDSPSGSSHRSDRSADETDDYRSVSGTAIAAAAVAAASPVAFLGWSLAAVPLLAAVLAVVALRDIARRSPHVTGRLMAIAALVAASLILAGSVASHAYEYATELPAGFARLSYADLQPAEGESPTSVPTSAQVVDGREVLLKGYIYPGKQQHGLVQFLLVRDQGDCCFGGNPKITDRVLVHLADPAGTDFTPNLTKVAGRFRVQPAGTSDVQGGVFYHLDQARIR
ncbi:MAG: hypothetical protein ACKO4T_05335 [Planctomycetaceae bacterium]